MRRFPNNPILRPELSAGIGENLNGPSLIRTPAWLPHPLGRYYLYFAHHQGKYIRLAYADHLAGPWKIYEPGTLRLDETRCQGHVASPDVHIDDERRRIRMYFHGPVRDAQHRGQYAMLATSGDGLRFTPSREILGGNYFRVFQWNRAYYAIDRAGRVLRSADGLGAFEQGPSIFSDPVGFEVRHTAIKLDGNRLCVFYSRIGDRPERILLAALTLTPNWQEWKLSVPAEVLQPEMDYEGARLPLAVSHSGWAPRPVRELRDPAIYRENNRTFLLYSVAGEHGIAIAELKDTIK